MSCPLPEELILFLYGEHASERALASHLLRCPPCQEEVRGLKRAGTAYRSAAPAWQPKQPLERPARRLSPSWALGLAAAALLASLVSSLGYSSSASSGWSQAPTSAPSVASPSLSQPSRAAELPELPPAAEPQTEAQWRGERQLTAGLGSLALRVSRFEQSVGSW